MNNEAHHAAPTVRGGGNVVPMWNFARSGDERQAGVARGPRPDIVDLAKQPDVLARLQALLTD